MSKWKFKRFIRIFFKKRPKNILNRPENQMSGILIYYWARLWIQQSIDLIGNTNLLPLLFCSRSSHSEPDQDKILSIIVSHTGVYFWMCVFIILSRGVLLSGFWIRFCLSHCPHPVMKSLGARVLRYCSFLSFQKPVRILPLLSGQSRCNCRHATQIFITVLKGFLPKPGPAFCDT